MKIALLQIFVLQLSHVTGFQLFYFPLRELQTATGYQSCTSLERMQSSMLCQTAISIEFFQHLVSWKKWCIWCSQGLPVSKTGSLTKSSWRCFFSFCSKHTAQYVCTSFLWFLCMSSKFVRCALWVWTTDFLIHTNLGDTGWLQLSFPEYFTKLRPGLNYVHVSQTSLLNNLFSFC